MHPIRTYAVTSRYLGSTDGLKRSLDIYFSVFGYVCTTARWNTPSKGGCRLPCQAKTKGMRDTDEIWVMANITLLLPSPKNLHEKTDIMLT